MKQQQPKEPISISRYKVWQQAEIDLGLKQQLKWMNDDVIQQCFGTHLPLEKEGMYGMIGAGTNRMNRYTIRRFAQGAAEFLVKQGRHKKKQGIVIGFDNRSLSPIFAQEAALIFAYNGFKVFLYEQPCPTPQLCFSIHELNAAAGFMITGNHLPKHYNGVKMFSGDGALLSDNHIKLIATHLNEIEHGFKVKSMSREAALIQGLIHGVGAEMGERYVEVIKNVLPRPSWLDADAKRLKVVYTPLHGTGSTLMKDVLNQTGFHQLSDVPEQEHSNETCWTITAPDPSRMDAYDLAIQMAKEVRAHLVMATDSSAESAGMAIRTPKGRYIKLSSNQCSVLLLHYLLSRLWEPNELPDNGVILKTITSSDLCRKIAASYGVHTMNTMPGFHHISEKKREIHRSGDDTFLFGFTGSGSYSFGNMMMHADGIQTCLLLCEMASYYQARGKTLYEVLRSIYRQFGYYKEDLISLSLSGPDEYERMKKLMEDSQLSKKTFWGGRKLLAISDYKQGVRIDQITGKKKKIETSQTYIVKLHLEDDVWIVLDLSDKKQRFDVYFSVNANGAEACQRSMTALKQDLTTYLFQHSGDQNHTDSFAH